jgi:hypothetical protein
VKQSENSENSELPDSSITVKQSENSENSEPPDSSKTVIQSENSENSELPDSSKTVKQSENSESSELPDSSRTVKRAKIAHAWWSQLLCHTDPRRPRPKLFVPNPKDRNLKDNGIVSCCRRSKTTKCVYPSNDSCKMTLKPQSVYTP